MTGATDLSTPRVMPLAGIKVLELTHIVAGPSAGQIFADLGADVTKIEAVDGGDQSRRAPGPNAAMFHFLNRNKRSVALDLKGRGREVFLKLATTADVIVDNFAFGAIDGLGLGYETLSEKNPGLIWVSIKGFLPGPAGGRPLLDELAQMMGGLAYMTGPRGEPLRAGASIIDVGAATYGVVAALAALRQRDIDGKGQMITAGLFETSVYWVGQWMAIAQAGGGEIAPMPELRQGQRMGWGVYQLFDTVDADQVFIGITSNRHWDRFCKAFDLPALHVDPRFADNATRVQNRLVLADLVQAVIATLTSADVQARLETVGIPFAPLRRPDQLKDDPQLNGAGQLLDTPMPDGSITKLPKLPFHASGMPMSMRFPAPRLGEHTAAVMRDLGYSDAEIDHFVAIGAVGLPQELNNV
jgi:crotonobetainyl-CoA:carnitine CoA-transferase CaiB-like acyl-CoA transferase